MSATSKNMNPPGTGRFRDVDQDPVAAIASNSSDRRGQVFKVTLMPRSGQAANTISPRTRNPINPVGMASVSLASASPVSEIAARPSVTDVGAWKNLERWAARIMWTVTSATIAIDLIATFGYRLGLPWRL